MAMVERPIKVTFVAAVILFSGIFNLINGAKFLI